MNRSNLSSLDKKAYSFLVTFFVILLLVVFLMDKGCGQELFQWRKSEEAILKNPDASGLHFIGSAYLVGSLDNTMKWWKSDLIVFACGVGWEIKDGLMPWERIGFLGGEGFSRNDLIMDVSGIVTHRLSVLIYNRVKYHCWNLNKINKRVK